MMKYLTPVLAAATLLTACAKTEATAPPEKIATNSCATAALIFAEWCPSCKVLEPKLKEAQDLVGAASVSFVNLDFSDRKVDAVYAQAKDAGIEAPLRAKFGDKLLSGLLLVVDTNQNKIVDTITKRATADEIAEKLTTAAQDCKD